MTPPPANPEAGGPLASASPGSPADRFLDRVRDALAEETFVRLVLSRPDPALTPLVRTEARPIQLRGEAALSVTLREPTRDSTRNFPPDAFPAWVAGELAGRFRAALLETTRRDWQLSLAPGRPPRLVAHKAPPRPVPPATHDRPRHRSLDTTANDWLHALGLTHADGRVLPSRADKHRQILRYTEILDHLVRDAGWHAGAPLRVADMGCGRGYLTFAAWHLLRRQRAFPAEVLGVEARPELVHDANATARRLDLTGLQFIEGDIAGAVLPPLDILIALHACNTATDDAIRRGIDLGARLLIVSPCCHRELRPQLGRPEPLAPILRHGIMAERFAEWATDGLRALFLEWAGYRVKAIEFVASEHTPKNLLLAGVRQSTPFQEPALRQQILSLKTFLGVQNHALDPLLARAEGFREDPGEAP
ncbi:MAG: SAM-dependent methyltransferase [Verrucomicrobiae bacterium]|nr:SAM-dependent methyltransferase [Verrucomicrobiae bacterium]